MSKGIDIKELREEFLKKINKLSGNQKTTLINCLYIIEEKQGMIKESSLMELLDYNLENEENINNAKTNLRKDLKELQKDFTIRIKKIRKDLEIFHKAPLINYEIGYSEEKERVYIFQSSTFTKLLNVGDLRVVKKELDIIIKSFKNKKKV